MSWYLQVTNELNAGYAENAELDEAVTPVYAKISLKAAEGALVVQKGRVDLARKVRSSKRAEHRNSAAAAKPLIFRIAVKKPSQIF